LCSDVEIEVSYEENGIVVLVKTGIGDKFIFSSLLSRVRGGWHIFVTACRWKAATAVLSVVV
jgi:hypothetical protein